jgi:two-component system, OmpR family, heavy metal sensor histidine kinase CusS
LTNGYSLTQRLAWRVVLLAALSLSLFSTGCWLATRWLLVDSQITVLERTQRIVQEIARAGYNVGGVPTMSERVAFYAPRRPGTRLVLRDGTGAVVYEDQNDPPWLLSDHVRGVDFGVEGTPLRGRLVLDAERDARTLTRLALLLLLGTAVASAGAWLLVGWVLRRGLLPLRELAERTQRIRPQQLNQRLAMVEPVQELQPWIDQFNALLGRVESAYAQLEAFNANVAHELRTPLAAVIGHLEVALSRERDAEALRETLLLSLERLRGLSAMVGDMLFLSRADRGALARRGAPVSLAALAQQVAEFHEAALDERHLALQVSGDATLTMDEGLIKRAVSNLIGNATRYAEPGSVVQLSIETGSEPGEVMVQVVNRGPGIPAEQLPHLFDRFYRADSARSDSDEHHGLGLAIVAAIARMHGGAPLARSANGLTGIGLSLRDGPVAT